MTCTVKTLRNFVTRRLVENLWAKKTRQAMLDAGGRLVLFERIPHDVVEEALAEIASLAAA